MAGYNTTYWIKVREECKTNWLWVINQDHSLLIGWDIHLKGLNKKGPEIYSVNIFECAQPPYNKKGYQIADQKLALEIITECKIKFPKLMATVKLAA